jgi:hypothetical protein
MVFWGMTPYSLVHGYQRFGGTYRFNLHGKNTKLNVLPKPLAAICQITRQILEDQNMSITLRGVFLTPNCEYCRADSVTGRYAAIHVVRSTASSPALMRG